MAYEWNGSQPLITTLDSFLDVMFMLEDVSGEDFITFSLVSKHIQNRSDRETLWHSFLWRDWLSPSVSDPISSPGQDRKTLSPSASPQKNRQPRLNEEDLVQRLEALFPVPSQTVALTSSLSSLRPDSSEPQRYQSLYRSIYQQYQLERKIEKLQRCNVQYYCKLQQSPLHYQKYLHHCADGSQCTDYSADHRKYWIHNTECALKEYCHFRATRKLHDELSMHPCAQGENCPSKSSWIHNLYHSHPPDGS